MPEPGRPLQLVCGDARHGVVELAHALARAAGCPESDSMEAALAHDGPVHLHFTERLWGAGPEAAAERVTELAAARPLTVTLHDLPQASDGSAWARRRAAFAEVAAAAEAVACNSRWEADLLEAVAPGVRSTVIPLPVPDPVVGGSAAGAVGCRALSRTVGLLGWIYPGKGHLAAIRASAALGETGTEPPAVRAIGRASPGHEPDVAELQALAHGLGVDFTVTGYLPAEALAEELAAVGVPLAAHEHISASASITTWIAAGRRPLVRDSAYAAEAEALRPGTLSRYSPPALATAVSVALDRPERTWLGRDVDLTPRLDDVAALYRRWWERTWRR